MKTYKVLKNQSIVDVAIQLYGNVDAVPELLSLNRAALGLGSDTLTLDEQNKMGDTELGTALKAGTVLNYDETSALRNTLALQVLSQYGNDAGEYILATATDNPVTVTPDVVVPPDPDPYVFHADTLVFLDDRVGDTPGGAWQDYITMDDAIALDRLVRDLHGEANANYATEDIWTKLKGVYPVMGSDQGIHEINLVDNVVGAERLSWNGATVHTLDAIGMDGVNDSADTGIIDGTDTAEDDVCIGIVVSNYVHYPAAIPDYPNNYMGAVNGSKLLWIRNIFNKYEGQVTTTSGAFTSTTAPQINDHLMMIGTAAYQSLYLGGSGLLIANKAYTAGTATGANFFIGKVGTYRGMEGQVNFAYISKGLTTAERKSMLNAVNYFLYQKGVRGVFNVIV